MRNHFTFRLAISGDEYVIRPSAQKKILDLILNYIANVMDSQGNHMISIRRPKFFL